MNRPLHRTNNYIICILLSTIDLVLSKILKNGIEWCGWKFNYGRNVNLVIKLGTLNLTLNVGTKINVEGT